MRAHRPLAVALSCLLCALANSNPATAAEYSQLWGRDGEKWTTTSRLPDFSHAGYRRGEKPLPQVKPGVSVKKFGAKGDGKTDDTAAFKKALAEVNQGAIEIPAGRYLITDLLEITRPNVVLRGENSSESILLFPRPLNEIKPNWGATTSGLRTSNYSWSGGFITIRGSFRSTRLTNITSSAKRGDQQIQVASTEKLKVGQEVELYQTDTSKNSLAIHLYSGDSGKVSQLKGRARMSLVTRIIKISGTTVEFDRPLRCEIRSEWKPAVRAFAPTVTESGIEALGFAFPTTPYKGHFTELGYNPIALRGVAHCWIRDIRVRNADSGPYLSGFFNTADGVVLESKRSVDRQNCTGHHGISFGGGDNLAVNFDIRTRFIHDITVSGYTSGNVAAGGRGVDLSLDHHRYAPHENLFTDLDAGQGTRLWKCGGGRDRGKHCAARGTFWNIRASNPLSYPPDSFGPPTMNLVGLATKQPTSTTPEGKWFEAIPPQQLHPQNLYRAQLMRRGRLHAKR